MYTFAQNTSSHPSSSCEELKFSMKDRGDSTKELNVLKFSEMDRGGKSTLHLLTLHRGHPHPHLLHHPWEKAEVVTAGINTAHQTVPQCIWQVADGMGEASHHRDYY